MGLHLRFDSQLEAFEYLSGGDVAIGREEFGNFCRGYLTENDDVHGDRSSHEIDHLFNLIDENKDGSISPSEFQALFEGEAARRQRKDFRLAAQLRSLLKEKFKSEQDCFQKLGGADDARITFEEFSHFCTESLQMDHPNHVRSIFDHVDKDRLGFISKAEFVEFAE